MTRLMVLGAGILFCSFGALSFLSHPASAIAKASTLSLNLSTSNLAINLNPTSGGVFGNSNNSTISVNTDNFTGYTLFIAASSNGTDLINGSVPSGSSLTNNIPSINAIISSSTFSSSATYNNKWGYKPSQYIVNNQGTNQVVENTDNYLPIPSNNNANTIDITNAPNTNNQANNYTFSIGARATTAMPSGTYDNTLVITAVANDIAYNITYDKNTTDNVSSMPSPNPQIAEITGGTSTAESYTTLSNATPTRTGYTFAGWCDVATTNDPTTANQTCSGTAYAASSNYGIDQTSDNTNITLYAIWKTKTYNITLDKNGGSGGSDTTTASYLSNTLAPITLPQYNYTVSGFTAGTDASDATISSTESLAVNGTFLGWYNNIIGLKVASNDLTPILQSGVANYTDSDGKWIRDSDATLYALWSGTSATSPTITKSGYTCGWDTNSSATDFTYKSGASVRPTSNLVLYGICITNPTITFTFDSNISSIGVNGQAVSTSGGSITLPAKSSYTISAATTSGYEIDTITVVSGNASVDDKTLSTATGNSTVHVTSRAKPVVTFNFDSNISSVIVKSGSSTAATISSSGDTAALSGNTNYTITVNTTSDDYEFNTMAVASGSATVSGATLSTATGNSTINITSRLSPVYTFTFDSGISSLVVNGNTINASGGTVRLQSNKTYQINTYSNSGYMPSAMTVTSGDATTSGNSITTGRNASIINVSSQAARNVNVVIGIRSGDGCSGEVTVSKNGSQIGGTESSDSAANYYSYTLTGGETYEVQLDGGNNGEGVCNIRSITVRSGNWYAMPTISGIQNQVSGVMTVGIDDADIYVDTVYGGCVTEGTLITLADGTKTRVEELTGDEELLVWDFDTGSYTSAPIVFIEPEEAADYDVIHLYFGDETDVETVYEHGFFDYTLGKYIYINNDNPEQYIGHEFIMQDGDTYKTVTLTRIEHETKHTTVYGLTTFKHFNFYNNDMLSIEGNITGMFNYFDVDKNTMSYDQAKKQADIEQYGLLTYEELVEHIGDSISELGFEAYNGQYLKVSIGKGLITWDGIKALAERYGHFTDQ